MGKHSKGSDSPKNGTQISRTQNKANGPGFSTGGKSGRPAGHPDGWGGDRSQRD